MLAAFHSKAKYLLFCYDFQIVAIIASIISSFIALAHNQPFNIDGITYLETAAAFLQGGVPHALAVYQWPFYSLFIAIISKISSLSIENSAFFLNTLLNTLTILAFIALVRELGGSRRTQLFALIVILVYPYLNHDRDNILRDFGYYAFALTSLLFFMRYLRLLNWRNAILWSFTAILASLFRIEGFVFVLLAPLALFFRSHLAWSKRFIAFSKLYALVLCVAVGGFALWWSPAHSSSVSTVLSTLFHYFCTSPSEILAHFKTALTQLQQTHLSPMFKATPSFLLAGLLSILLQNIVLTMGVLYVILAFHALCYRTILFDHATQLGWLAYLILTALTLVIFLLNQFFLSERYVEFLSLLLILSVPFSLSAIYSNWKQQRACFTGKKWVFPLIAVLLGVLAINSIGHFGASKVYLKEAGAWIETNTPPTYRVFSNNVQLIYYSHRPPGLNKLQTVLVNDDPFDNLQHINFNDYDQLALTVHHHQVGREKLVLDFLKLQPVKTFKNSHDDKVLIFNLNHP